MFLSIFAVTIAAAVTVLNHDKTAWDRWRMAGQIWSEWVHALAQAPAPIPSTPPNWHGDWTEVRDRLYGGVVDDLPASGLGADVGRDYGIPITDIPMHFTYVEIPPSPELTCPSPTPTEYNCERVGAAMFRPRALGRLDAIRRGAVDGGLAVAGPGACSTTVDVLRGVASITAHESRLEGRLPASWGGCFKQGDLVAVVHVSIPVEQRALHRSVPAGHPDLVGMEAALDMTGQDMTVGRDVDATAAQGIAAAEVQFTPELTATANYPGVAVRADELELNSLSLTATGLTRPHEIGSSSATPTEDEALQLGSGDFQSLETACKEGVGTGGGLAEDCATAVELAAPGQLETARNMDVRREDATGTQPGSGVRAGKTNAGTLDILSGYCHGCEPWENP